MSSQRAPIYFLLQTIICQILTFASCYAITQLANLDLSNTLTISTLILICACLGYSLAYFLRLPVPWQIINFLILPTALVSPYIALSNEPFGVGIIIALLLYIPTFWTRVPYYPTSEEMYKVVLEQLPQDKPFSFIDLGCGFGGLLNYIAKHRPMATLYGNEISPLAWIVSTLRSMLFRKRITISFKSFWNINLAQYDYIYAFLAPPPMPTLWQKCRNEMHPNAFFFVNSFPVPAKEIKVLEVDDYRKTKLFIYRV